MRFADNRDVITRAWVNELQVGCMKSDASDSRLRRFGWRILPVADHRMSERCKLDSDLILQSGQQRNPDERRAVKWAFDRIAQLSAGRFRISWRAQFLKHSFAAKVVNKRPFFDRNVTANHGEILPHGSVRKKLLNQCVAISIGFCKKQYSGSKAINAVHDKGPLSLRFQVYGKKRLGGWQVGVLDRHCEESGWLIDDYDRIVFVENSKLP